MKRLLLALASFGAVYAAACGGGGSSNPPPPPVTGNFSNSSLKGTYAYSMSGSTFNSNGFNTGSVLVARVGSFVSDGNGNITAAMEDVATSGTPTAAVTFSGGTYSVQANGTGTLTFNSGVGGGLQLTIAMNSSSGGVMIQTDLNATSSGSFSLQSTSAFVTFPLTNSFAFDVSGMDSNGAPLSVVGQFATNGAGAVTTGVFDLNDGSSTTGPSGAQAITGGAYAIDATNGPTFGRGSITLNGLGLGFAFYIVNSTQILLIEEDNTGTLTFGSTLQQSNVPTQTGAGSFAFLTAGTSVLGNAPGSSLVRGGRFTTDASGNVTNIQLDDNNNGTVTPTITSGFSNTKFAIDTVNVGSGRGTLTFTASNQANPFTFVFYLSSPSQAFIQDITMGVIADGSMLGQSGTFSASALAANYVFNFSGVNLSQTNGFEEDFDGQYALSSSAAVSGEVNFVELGSSSSRNPAFLNIPLTGMLTINGDGTGANNYTVTTGNSPSTTLTFHAYLATGNTMLLVGVDTNRVDTGNASPQTQ